MPGQFRGEGMTGLRESPSAARYVRSHGRLPNGKRGSFSLALLSLSVDPNESFQVEETRMTVRLTRRGFVGAAVAVPALAAIPVSLQGVGAQDGIVVTMVTDTAGLGDQNFNDLANAGGEKAATDLGIDWKVIESVDIPSYVPNLTAGAEQGPLTVGVGFLLTDAITSVASQFPDAHFAIIDAEVDAPNVQSVLFKEHEAAFLGGVAAGLLTKTDKLGLIGGQRIPPVIRYEVGFRAGVESVNPDAEVVIAYADSFGDPDKGKELALAQFADGADIVFPVAGLTGVGAYSAVAELNKPGEQWVIGVDVTQDQNAPGFEYIVVRKGVDIGVYKVIEQEVNGNFTPGINRLGLAEGGVAFEDPNNRVPADVANIVNDWQAKILDGSVVVPSTDDELAAFEAGMGGSPVASPEATPAG
jgi:basic membrane protein A